MKVLAVDSEGTGISGTQADGILGMTPQVSSSSNAQLFVERLFSNGIISEHGFGVNYRSTSETSKIILGGYDTSVVTDSTKMTYVPLRDTTYWSLNLLATSYGSTSLTLTAKRFILDTGTSLTYFNTDDWNTIYGQISNGKT
mmetsp:Transcript_16600/g.19200  ORF Transcript_16600/g.19200 Transcript_16600/m.19200 type:complete len:142 (-) Transcript_16600:378-803(-)